MCNRLLAVPPRLIISLCFVWFALSGSSALADDIAHKVTGQYSFEDGQLYATLSQRAGEQHFVLTIGNGRVSTVRQDCNASGLRLCLKFDNALILIPEDLTVGTSVKVDAAVAVNVKSRIKSISTPFGTCKDACRLAGE